LTSAAAVTMTQGAAINGVSLTAPGALSNLLLPPGVSPGSAVGAVSAALAVPSSPLGGWAFRVSKQGRVEGVHCFALQVCCLQ
jgi:hypothetical protein